MGRAHHAKAEDVRITCSFARAEKLLGREYHGRFLIELLQNAADASRGEDEASKGSRVAVQITEGPALLVANEGTPMSAEVVIESLGHIGASTKPEGEAIGHKGIGFKSVLELTLTPEIYSGLQETRTTLSVGFDPKKTKDTILASSPGWDEMVAGVQGLDVSDPFAAIPVLRYPYWIDELPAEVASLKRDAFNTVVRLPFDERFAGRLGFDSETWLANVREHLEDVSDQILLLLGSFKEVIIEDCLAGSKQVIRPKWEQAPVEISEEVTREVVRVERNDRLSSRWRLFRRTLPDRKHLAGEVAVGIRVSDAPGAETVLPAVEDHASSPFHLFFPTRIPSGAPFLLHAYFQVDAARTGFYLGSEGSAERNQALLEELAKVTKIAVTDASEVAGLDLVSLVDLVAAAGEPEDPLAQQFRARLLGLLDDVPWIPLQKGEEGPQAERPGAMFGAPPEVLRLTGRVFPAPYIRWRTGLGLPSGRLSDGAIELVRSRLPSDAPGTWETIGLLCRPGEYPLWDGQEADHRFLSLLDLLSRLEAENRHDTQELLASLRGDPESRLIPAVGAESSRDLLPVPDPSEATPGQRSRLVMARVRSSAGQNLVPPAELDVSFLPDGLLSSEAELDRAKPLGIRPFTVDSILDRLNGIEKAAVSGEALVRFLWRLLTRDRVSAFSTKEIAGRVSDFDPGSLFWARPGRARQSEATRLQQQRERYMAAVPLPCRDGVWREAGRIAFGADWADWLETQAGTNPMGATRERISAYRAMEEVSPGPETLLASPEEIRDLLDEDVFEEPELPDGDEEPAEAPGRRQREVEKHAFLMRLGVWEVPPVEAYESRDPRTRSKFPWAGPVADRQQEVIEQSGGWQFSLDGWSGRRHHNVYLAEDYRFVWPLEEMARRDASSLATLLRQGAGFYATRSGALLFCPGCADSGGSHRVPHHSTSADGYPSSLSIQLRSERWVPATLDGEPLPAPATPDEAWWQQKSLAGGALLQSPWRLVPLCGPQEGMNEDLRRLSGVNTLEEATVGVLERLLRNLRARFEKGELSIEVLGSTSARQAFFGLHRIAYERLSELAVEQPEAATVLERTGVLCDLGDNIVYRSPDVARHDDGRFSAYVRYFVGSIPFAALARNRGQVADRLGITPFELQLTRRGADEIREVTEELNHLHSERIAELLAIMVHHNLGSQTLDATSGTFEGRARRLRNLRIMQLYDLVVDATVKGGAEWVTLGEGSDKDLFLEDPTSASPVLYHDFSGNDWKDDMRRKIGPYLAAILENPAYSHTYTVFLLEDSDPGREEFLRGLGITNADVDAIRSNIGIVGKADQERYRNWFAAILEERGSGSLDPDNQDDLANRLQGAGLAAKTAIRLVELGGDEDVRRDTGPGSALSLLYEAGVDLKDLHERLRGLGESGLNIKDAQRAFAHWIGDQGRRLSTVLATSMHPDEAKAKVRSLETPHELRLSIDPALEDLLPPVVTALEEHGMNTDGVSLAHDAAATLAALGGFGSVGELDARVPVIFDKEERERFIRGRANQWQREIQLLAVLARTGPAEPRARIREIDRDVTAMLPPNPGSPTELRDCLGELFGNHPTLASRVRERLEDTLNAGAPDREQLMSWAEEDGVAVDRLPAVLKALEQPRREHVRKLAERAQLLDEKEVRPAQPPALRLLGLPGKARASEDRDEDKDPDIGPRRVPAIKVDEKLDRRKRELGDEGEQWTLATVVDDLMRLDEKSWNAAIEDIVRLLGRFEGTPVDRALAHATRAREHGLDDEERIDELSGLLHVSRYSDAFGFDLIGWLPSGSSARRAVCLEVKSSGSSGFQLSGGEWSFAEQLHGEGAGDQYAVLVVRRDKTGGVPGGMDLLRDPVSLVKTGYLHRAVDGYRIAYQISDPTRERAGT